MASRDPLVDMAESYYGSRFYYFLILGANGFGAEEVLSSGQRLKLPARGDKKTLKKGYWWRKHLGVPE